MTVWCEDCKFWDNSTQRSGDQPDTTGLCRRLPPRASKYDGQGFWPFTSDTDWCGKFKDRPPPPAPRDCTKNPACMKPDGHDGECDEVPF